MDSRKDLRWWTVGFLCGTAFLLMYLGSKGAVTASTEINQGEFASTIGLTEGHGVPKRQEVNSQATSSFQAENGPARQQGGARSHRRAALLRKRQPKDTSLADDPLSVLSTRIPECAKQYKGRAENAFMLMISHSGSTALITQLASHQDVGNYTQWHNLEPLANLDADFAKEEEKLEWCYSKAHEAGKMGLLKYDGRSVLAFASRWKSLLMKHNVRIMYMHRSNLFKRAVGRYPYYYLNYKGHFGGLQKGEKKECEKTNSCSYKVDPYNIHCEMKRAFYVDEALRARVDAVLGEDKCALEILYEDYLYYPRETLHQIQDFLGLERVSQIDSDRVKVTNDGVCNVVSNYADICAAFNECSRWSWMINDEKNGCLCSNYEYTSLGGDDTNPLCTLDRMPNERRWCQG
eukprot:Plantae.Rhodophyta-Purpureofilum_apyrenoidigerum.ctg2475.p1 GENE.Plantae.Rhodophyta-Purpureofilum_apyrenoidigerum.ctg2475~~Plantae.Rhodophyta-Purpureofilum_apyrenoidigerum.ctg2475.p1  ORF type:complete len:405 (+),score=70.94 Plantae.Rhodophyta-Purpureofilum_apyrenoidigerum.ctg2475:261-1475(+)